MGGWYNNYYEDEIWWGDWFDSREAAIADGLRQYIDVLNDKPSDLFKDCVDELPTYFYIGEKKPYIPEIDVDNIIERLQVDADCECGEVADDFLEWRDIEDIVGELQESLQRELDAWLERHGLMPTFGEIINIEKINIKDYL